MNEKELKPCPFCGGTASLNDAWPHWAYCTVCGAKVQSVKFDEEGQAEAIEKWNRRYTKQESRALLPCKYCGSKRQYTYRALSNGYTGIGCHKCGIQAEKAKTDIQARRNWNTLMSVKGD